MKRHITGLLALIIAICSTPTLFAQDDAPERWEIRGKITALTAPEDDNAVWSATVEGEKADDTNYAKARIRIEPDSKVEVKNDKGEWEAADRSALKKGQLIEVLSDGNVMESFPVQFKAVRIRVLEQPMEKDDEDNAKEQGEAPHYEGTIKNIQHNDDGSCSFLIMKDGQNRPLVRVAVPPKTDVFSADGDAEKAHEMSDLQDDLRIRLWHTGMIGKSMPPFATAKRIEIVAGE